MFLNVTFISRKFKVTLIRSLQQNISNFVLQKNKMSSVNITDDIDLHHEDFFNGVYAHRTSKWFFVSFALIFVPINVAMNYCVTW